MPSRLPTAAALLAFASLTPAADPPNPPAAAAAAVREVVGHRGSCADRPENTLASYRRAIDAGAHAAEVDARTTRDGFLVCLHDPDLARTTDGTGRVGDRTLAEIQKLDAGRKFDAKYAGERVPELREVLAVCRGKIDVLIDLKESDEAYDKRVAAAVTAHGDPRRTILGVRSAEQARRFRELVPAVGDVEAFARAGVTMVRLWPKWLSDPTLVPRVRALGLELHLGAGGGTAAEVLPLLAHRPESLSSDDPARLVRTVKEIAAGAGGVRP